MAAPLLTPEAARAQASLDRHRAAELAARYAGWRVWTASRGSRVATRTGAAPIPKDDPIAAKTLMADTWTELEAQLEIQAAHDAELAADQ